MRTDDPRHARLEAEVSNVLRDLGFWTHSTTYHSVLPNEMIEKLRLLDTPSALYLRARADRLALHKTHPICFEWECKTRHPGTRSRNWAIEALPLAHHILKARLGVHILYCYQDAVCGIDAGFWCHALPRISCVMMTERGEALEAYLRTVFSREWIGYEVPFQFTRSRGSRDPFVLIEEPTVLELYSWRMEIAALLPEVQPPRLMRAVT